MKVILEDKVIVAALQIGDEFIGRITALIQERNIQAGSLSAIGALRDFELGYYYLERKEYDRKKFEPVAELISCSGNIAMREGKPFLHVHAALGQQDFSVIGGHLFSGIVAVTAEVVVRVFAGKLERNYDERTGLYLLDECRLS